MPRRTVVNPAFGQRLREFREACGWSYRELAREVPCSHVHIWELERGAKAPSPELAARLDGVLAAGGQLAALARARDHAAAEPTARWRPREEHFGRRDAEALADALVAEAPTAGTALRLAHEWMVAEPPQVAAVRAGRRVGAETVTRIERRVHQLRLLDDHVGGADSYVVVAAELSVTADLLRNASYTDEVGRRLLAAVGELAQLAGWVASDAGRHADAERLYLAGARAAHAGGDVEGAANNLSCLAYQMSNVGDCRDAVVLARTAVRRAERVAVPTSRALLLERAAWAHARAGEGAACERVLGEVEDVFAARDPGDADPPWVYWLDPDEIQIMAGRCWTELARPLRAVPILRRATARYGDGQARETALYLSWLAEALAQAHEADEAAAVAMRTLALAGKTHSSRVDDRLAALQQRLRPARGASTVDEFLDAYQARAASGGNHPSANGGS